MLSDRGAYGKPKILIVSATSRGELGGINSYIASLTECLKSDANVHSVYAPSDSTLINRVLGLSVFYELFRKRGEKFSAVIVNDPHFMGGAIGSLLLHTDKRVAVSHGWIFHRRKPRLITWLFKLWVYLIAFMFDLVVCVSKQDKIFSKSKFLHVPNPVKSAFYLAPLIEIEQRAYSICAYGRSSPNKNIDLIGNLLFRLKSLKTWLAKDGFLHCDLGLRSLDDEDLVHLLSDTKIFISLSKYEGFGLAVVEAAACGCFLILSDIEAHRELNPPGAVFICLETGENDLGILELVVRQQLGRADLESLSRANKSWARRYDGAAYLGALGLR